MSIEIHLAANQAMAPSRLNIESMTENVDLPVFIGPTDINNGSTVEGIPFIPTPLDREIGARWSPFDATYRSFTIELCFIIFGTGSALEIP